MFVQCFGVVFNVLGAWRWFCGTCVYWVWDSLFADVVKLGYLKGFSSLARAISAPCTRRAASRGRVVFRCIPNVDLLFLAHWQHLAPSTHPRHTHNIPSQLCEIQGRWLRFDMQSLAFQWQHQTGQGAGSPTGAVGRYRIQGRFDMQAVVYLMWQQQLGRCAGNRVWYRRRV